MTSAHTGVMVGGCLLALLCSIALANLDASLDTHWELWKTKHQRNYFNELEELSRRMVWEKNLWTINTHNLEASMGLHTYTKAMNHMGDLTKEEALMKYANLRIPKDLKRTSLAFKAKGNAPESLDWRQKGYVTRVKNQGDCGSCWAFSVVGSMEGHLFRTTGKLVDLSPQQLVDCARNGSIGCEGGLMDKAFAYVIQNGLESDAAYPYEGSDETCRYDAQYVVANCSSFSFVQPSGDEGALKQAVADVGPISVGVQADEWLFYSSGIFSDPNCNEGIDHGVVVVGYGAESVDKKYWLVKNSWGEEWGENGYIRVARDQSDMCLIATYATYCDIN